MSITCRGSVYTQESLHWLLWLYFLLWLDGLLWLYLSCLDLVRIDMFLRTDIHPDDPALLTILHAVALLIIIAGYH